MEENNNICGNTYIPEYSSTEICEKVSTKCVIHEPSLSELSLSENSTVEDIITAVVSSLLNLSSVQTNTTNGRVTKNYTVGELPTGNLGQIATVTDADTISYRAVAVGGGSDTALVFYDGTNWIYH